jgi:conjugative transfer signal peptidase TraF
MKPLVLLGVAIPMMVLGVISVINVPIKLIYNPSESAPIGFYWVDYVPVFVGDYVAVWVPDRVKNLVEQRGILPPNTPMIKLVRGVEGDEVCRIGQQIWINNEVVSIALLADSRGRSMPVWRDCLVLTKDQVFLLQDHPQSFDGRYFGPTDRSLIIGKAIKLPVF